MDDIDIDLGSVVGTQGPEGKTLYLGEGEPDSDLGSAGCTYMDTEVGQIYKKTSSGWEEKVQVSIGSVVVDPSLDPDSSHAVRNSAIAAKFAEVATALASKQDALTIDEDPTSGSENPVMSGGVRAAIDAAVAETAGDVYVPTNVGTAEFSGVAAVYRTLRTCHLVIHGNGQIALKRNQAFAQIDDGFRPNRDVSFVFRGTRAANDAGLVVGATARPDGDVVCTYIIIEADGVAKATDTVKSIKGAVTYRCTQ